MSDQNRTITVIPNGPLIVMGDSEITLPSGEKVTKETRVSLCRCGLSANKPYCDGGHKGKFQVD